MFREPGERALSAYFHMREWAMPSKLPVWMQLPRRPRNASGRGHAGTSPVGCCTQDWGWPPSVFLPVHAGIYQGKPPAEVIGRFQGCMTNMVLGHGCMEQRAWRGRDVARAIDRVSQFHFVGEVRDCLQRVRAIALHTHEAAVHRYPSGTYQSASSTTSRKGGATCSPSR
jgi:hypothetical protein